MKSFFKEYCSQEWLDFIDFHCIEVEVKKGDFIFDKGEKTTGLFLVGEGRVKVLIKDSEGGDRIVRLAADGDILGHRGFGGNWTYPITAVAYEDTTLKFLPIQAFNIIGKTNPDFSYGMMMFFAEELRKSEEKTLSLPVLGRIAKAIYENYKAFGYDEEDEGKLAFTISRLDMASMSITTYESCVRAISELNKMKIIKTEGKGIRILNMKKLKAQFQ